jgi:hypothetical protein
MLIEIAHLMCLGAIQTLRVKVPLFYLTDGAFSSWPALSFGILSVDASGASVITFFQNVVKYARRVLDKKCSEGAKIL